MRREIFFLFAFVLVISFCSRNNSSQDLEDIRETVFRYQFGMPAAFYCVALQDNQDPSEELMQRFKNNNPPVKRRSECSISPTKDDPGGPVVHPASSKYGILFTIHSINLSVLNKVEVDASRYLGGLHGETHRYRLIRKDGKWKVEKDEVLSVS